MIKYPTTGSEQAIKPEGSPGKNHVSAESSLVFILMQVVTVSYSIGGSLALPSDVIG